MCSSWQSSLWAWPYEPEMGVQWTCPSLSVGSSYLQTTLASGLLCVHFFTTGCTVRSNIQVMEYPRFYILHRNSLNKSWNQMELLNKILFWGSYPTNRTPLRIWLYTYFLFFLLRYSQVNRIFVISSERAVLFCHQQVIFLRCVIWVVVIM